jgi:hypothetical protein
MALCPNSLPGRWDARRHFWASPDFRSQGCLNPTGGGSNRHRDRHSPRLAFPDEPNPDPREYPLRPSACDSRDDLLRRFLGGDHRRSIPLRKHQEVGSYRGVHPSVRWLPDRPPAHQSSTSTTCRQATSTTGAHLRATPVFCPGSTQASFPFSIGRTAPDRRFAGARWRLSRLTLFSTSGSTRD